MDKKKHSLRNEKLKPNRASETEEQRKERLLIRREKDRAGRRLRKCSALYRDSSFQSDSGLSQGGTDSVLQLDSDF